MTIKLSLTPLDQCVLATAHNKSVALYQGRVIEQIEFRHEVAKATASFLRQSERNYALFFEEAYPFTVKLFALWHAGKTVWISANNRPATADKLVHQGCRLVGDWPSIKNEPMADLCETIDLTALNAHETRLILFTSGSTGQPQAIQKALWQLQAEIDALEQLWGDDLAESQVLATVSHQHVYGLLFKILWPLASGRCFQSDIFFTPESLLKAAKGQPAYWIASPAQLKRLDSLSPWSEIDRLKMIFSSGGILADEVAIQIGQQSKPKLIDIYGSSETGGIAWRSPLDNADWQPFLNITLKTEEGYAIRLHSPYLPATDPFYLHDKIELLNNGQFKLLGRSDRIVKIEEKRLSLNEMEQTLQLSAWIEQAHCRLWQTERVRIACVIALTPEGKEFLKNHGRLVVIKELRERLLIHFEAVVLPKRWLFMDQLLTTTQSKVDTNKLDQLLSMDSHKLPQIIYINQQDDDQVELSLGIHADLLYFKGHFPTFPILPGVTQLAWAEQFGKLFFPITQPFTRMEAIKFKKIIKPDETLNLILRWSSGNGKLYFDFSSAIESHSSGRLIYGMES